MSKTAKALSWFALVATAVFVSFAVGRKLNTELLSFPIIALAIAQLLVLRSKKS
jgi:hypothetical protein